MRWVSIDPGKHYSGLAYWDGAELDGVDWLPNSVLGLPLYGLAVVEMPQLRGRMAKERPKDQMDLAFAAGWVSALGRYYKTYYPSTWKGSESKSKNHKRTLKALTERELRLVANLSKESREHVMDAIGIGLYHLAVTGEREESV